MVVPGGELGAADFQSVGRGAGGCTGMWEGKVEKETLRRAAAIVAGGEQKRAIMTLSRIGGEDAGAQVLE